MKINIKKISYLINFLNQFKKSKHNNEIYLANPFFHVSKLHPEILSKYQLFFKQSFRNFFKEILYLIRNLLSKVFTVFIYSNYLRFKNFFFINHSLPVNEKFDVIFISNLNSKKQIGKDTYFRTFLNKIEKKKNLKYKIFYVNSSNLDIKFINNFENSKKKIINKYTDFGKEIFILYNQIKLFLFFFFKLLFSNKNKLLNFLIMCSCFSGQYRFNLITYYEIIQILKKNYVKHCLQIYEGNAIDNLILLALKNYSPHTLRCGFFHPGLYKNSLALSNYSKNELLQILFTSSHYAKIFFLKKKKFNKIYSVDYTFPSNRKKNFLKKESKYITFLSEGLQYEETVLINLAKSLYNKDRNLVFNFMFHPNANIKKLTILLKTIFKRNFYVNDYRLCSKSYYLIYRGSSRAFDLVSNYKIRPVYYNLNSEINIDPLVDHNSSWKLIIDSSDQFFKKINHNYKELDRIKCIKFCKNFYKFKSENQMINKVFK